MNIIDDSEQEILDRLGLGTMQPAIKTHIRTCLERCYVAGYHHGKRKCRELEVGMQQLQERNADLRTQVALLMTRLSSEPPERPPR